MTRLPGSQSTVQTAVPQQIPGCPGHVAPHSSLLIGKILLKAVTRQERLTKYSVYATSNYRLRKTLSELLKASYKTIL